MIAIIFCCSIQKRILILMLDKFKYEQNGMEWHSLTCTIRNSCEHNWIDTRFAPQLLYSTWLVELCFRFEFKVFIELITEWSIFIELWLAHLIGQFFVFMCTISIKECLNNTQQLRTYIALAITTYRFVRGISWTKNLTKIYTNIVLRAFYSYWFIKYWLIFFPSMTLQITCIVQSNINLCLLIQILCVQITIRPIVFENFIFLKQNENYTN